MKTIIIGILHITVNVLGKVEQRVFMLKASMHGILMNIVYGNE